MTAQPKRSAPSLALEAAALAYAAAVAALEAERAAERAMGRAAVALWKAERRRGARKP